MYDELTKFLIRYREKQTDKQAYCKLIMSFVPISKTYSFTLACHKIESFTWDLIASQIIWGLKGIRFVPLK